VRRAFLCGEDPVSGASYEHRKGWVVEKLAELAGVFTIDVCAYAVMSNHYHLVLRIDEAGALGLSDEAVAERWMGLFSGHLLVSRWLKGECGSEAEERGALEIIGVWRSGLMDISWFMRCLNESIARRANAEDGCKGRFWEGRFKSRALLDEKAVLACMSYVDLNPVRAQLADTPEDSDFTSIQQRIHEAAERMIATDDRPGAAPEVDGESAQAGSEATLPRVPLMAFAGGAERADRLPYDRLSDYLELVEWTGKCVVPGKRGAFAEGMPSIIERLGFDEESWLAAISGFDRRFRDFVGGSDSLRRVREHSARRWIRGSRACACFDRVKAEVA
jgi:REP element-mobilizing transposase RayT